MGRATGVTIVVAILTAGIGSGCGKPPSEAAARQCLAIWESV